MQNGSDARVTMRRFDNAAFRAYTNVTVTSQKNACPGVFYVMKSNLVKALESDMQSLVSIYINST